MASEGSSAAAVAIRAEQSLDSDGNTLEESQSPVAFEALRGHNSAWDPQRCRITLNCCFEARAVPSVRSATGMRTDEAHLVVLDDFFGEPERIGLLMSLVGGHDMWDKDPPASMWDCNTADDAEAAKTWGLQTEFLKALSKDPCPAVLEIQSRLMALYPEFSITHMPSESMQVSTLTSDAQPPNASDQESTNPQAPNDGAASSSVIDCCNILANAPVHGDHYEYHADADPLTLPDSVWRRDFGDYSNREQGMPLLVSLLLYLVDDSWEINWHGETLFLDTSADVGVCVRPRSYRAVLMDQDVYHRIVAPSRLAEQPRYSLVWKLAFLPRFTEQESMSRVVRTWIEWEVLFRPAPLQDRSGVRQRDLLQLLRVDHHPVRDSEAADSNRSLASQGSLQ